MKMLFGWSVFIGVLWFIAFAAAQIATTMAHGGPDADAMMQLTRTIQDIGWGLASFAKPLLQLAIILLILLEAGKRLGIVSDQMTLASTYDRLLGSTTIQAAIAIIIVTAVSISALAGVGQTDVLKDLALVVVGFYFGTKKAEDRLDAPVVEPAPSAPSAPSPSSGRDYERSNPVA